MHARKDQTDKGLRFPTDWETKVSDLLNLTYESECKAEENFFEVFGLTYPNEVLLVVSFKSTIPGFTPITYKASADLKDNTDANKTMDILVNSIGIFMDKFFAQRDDFSYQSFWEEVDFEKISIWYRASREDFALTLKADELLNDL